MIVCTDRLQSCDFPSALKKNWNMFGGSEDKTYLCSRITLNITTMANETQLDQLERLVRLIADDNELLNRANDFMQNLVCGKFDYRGRTDISAELAETDWNYEGRHQ